MVRGKIQYVHRIQAKRPFISALSKSKTARDHTGPKVVLKYSALKPPMRSPCIKSAPSPAAKADLVLRERHTHLHIPLRADLNPPSHGMSKLFSFQFERFATLATLS